MESKKISFGFSKIAKKTIIVSTKDIQKEENQVELIKCLEGKEIKLIEEKKEIAPLVIPMLENTKTSAALASLLKRRAVLLGEDDDKQKDNEKIETPVDNGAIQNASNTKEEDLEKRAARELLAELQAQNGNETTTNYKLVLPVTKPDELPLDGAKEPSVRDYEDIPVKQFGLAMLRGMGWVEPPKKEAGGLTVDDGPVLRPKGMGLGADKALKPKPLLVPPEANEKLEIKKKAYVRILGGKHKDSYGQIEGFDDDQGRVIVKMAIGGAKTSFNEFLCQPVARNEFAQYGKCINSAKYDEYKRLENDHGVIVKEFRDSQEYKVKKDINNTERLRVKHKNELVREREFLDDNDKRKRNFEIKFERKRGEEKPHRKFEEVVETEKKEKWINRDEKSADYSEKKYNAHIEHSSTFRTSDRDYKHRQQRQEQRKSRSRTPKRKQLRTNEESTDTSESSDDSDSAYERQSRPKKKSTKSKKKSTKRTKSSRRHKNSRSRSSSASLMLISDSEDEKQRSKAKKSKIHKKKTKKSKKPRSRTHSRSRDKR